MEHQQGGGAGVEGLVGRAAELRALQACLRTGRHVLLEGPVGVGKTHLARQAGRLLGRRLVRVDGDGRYSEAKLVGHFDPPMVLEGGYRPEAFRRGPLVEAMEDGAILLINELNRMPEGVQNVLLPALDEGLLTLPHLGELRAAPGFGVVATMNPREFVATGHLSEALLDRFELLRLDYQAEAEEVAIVAGHAPDVPMELAIAAVELTRRTREDPRFRRGASVRAAIALAELAMALGGESALAEAAALALPTRVELKEDTHDSWPELIAALDPSKKKHRSA